MADQALALFASTSPSYLILQSLDRANLYLAEGYSSRLAETAAELSTLKTVLTDHGYSLLGDEEMKVCIESKEYGYYGFEIAEYLLENGIVCEFYDRDFTVMMFTPEIGVQGFEKLKKALAFLPKREEIKEKSPSVGIPERAMTIREATLSPSYEIEAEKAIGKVLATANVSCPPAIPILVCGEIIDENAINCFKYYGIQKCRVVD
jgi:arginine/lysine/ornithine decarboxylase